MNSGIIKIEMFDEKVYEITHEGIRYILRRNPNRVEEIAGTRQQKHESIEQLIQKENRYLRDHPQATLSKALERVNAKIRRLKIHPWLSALSALAEDRALFLKVDETTLNGISLLDGCYVIKSDLPESIANSQIIHDRYTELSEVERAFRTCKTGHLELRPVYVQTKISTRGHAFVVMLAYLIVRELHRGWSLLDVTVQEGLRQLSTLCAMEMEVKGQGTYLRIPMPRESSQKLLKALGIQLPLALTHKEVPVVTRKKLIK